MKTIVFFQLALLLTLSSCSTQKPETNANNASTVSHQVADKKIVANDAPKEETPAETSENKANKKFQPKLFDYEKYSAIADNAEHQAKFDNFVRQYADKYSKEINEIQEHVNSNNSTLAVIKAKEIYETEKDSPFLIANYAYILFFNGKLRHALEIMEEAMEHCIKQFGFVHHILIRPHSVICRTMAKYGIKYTERDGMSIHGLNEEFKDIKDEEAFRRINREAALHDFRYLARSGDAGDVYNVADILGELGRYEESNAVLDQYVFGKNASHPQYAGILQFRLLKLNNDKEVNRDALEDDIQMLLATHDDNYEVLETVADAYKSLGKNDKAEEYKKQVVCHRKRPKFLETSLSCHDIREINETFGINKLNDEEKLEKLRDIFKKKAKPYAIAVAALILYMHENHSNGVEEEATEFLKKNAKHALDTVHALFFENKSTCTINAAAEIMAHRKDERSWQIMLDRLPDIATQSALLIPSRLPEYMMLFDKKRATVAILEVLKDYIDKEGNYTLYPYLEAIKDVKTEVLEKIATEKLGYEKSQLKKLLEAIE